MDRALTSVGMARVYNWDVKERRKKKGTAMTA